MSIKLFIQAIVKFLLGIMLVGALLFIPAKSFSYWNAWLFMGLLFIPMFVAGIVMMIKNPELLKKRLNNKEKENEQKVVIALSGLMFLAGFIVAGLNYRYSWILLPRVVIVIGSVLFIVAYILYAEVLRENFAIVMIVILLIAVLLFMVTNNKIRAKVFGRKKRKDGK